MLIKFLLSLADGHPVFGKAKRLYQAIRDRYRQFVYDILPIDDKLMVFEAFRSTKYVDSPKAIYEKILNDPAFSDYHFIWCFTEPDKHRDIVNPRTKLVKHESSAYFRTYARSKYWVVNGWVPLRAKKKDGQVALQCWHGTPLKRLRYDIGDTVQTGHKEGALRDNDLDMVRYDYLISPSAFATRVFTSAFNLEQLNKTNIIIETGYPRNDFLTTYKSSNVTQIKKQLGLDSKKKVLLYAPTWRDDQNAGYGYTYKTSANFDYLQDRLSSDWVILFRAHSLVGNTFNFNKYKGFVYDVSNVDDVNDLYIVSDALMTDYSSVFFDYANLRRPIIFFMYDLEHYQKDLRGFYLELKELPGDIVKTEKEITTILSDLPAYNKKHAKTYQKFHDKFNYLDDGRATERVVEEVFRVSN